MAKSFIDVLAVMPADTNRPVAFVGTLVTDPAIKESPDLKGGTIKRAHARIVVSGKLPEDGTVNAKEVTGGFELPVTASFRDAEYLASLKKGSQVVGIGYLWQGDENSTTMIIVRRLIHPRDGEKPVLKTGLFPVWLKEGEKDVPALIVGTCRTKYAKEFNGGIRISVSIYKGADTIRKAFPDQEMTISEGNEYLNLDTRAFSFSAETLKKKADGEDFIAAGRLTLDEYQGVKRPHFIVERVLAPVEGGATGTVSAPVKVDKEFVKTLFASEDFKKALRNELQADGLLLEVEPTPEADPGNNSETAESSEDDAYGYLNE